MKDVREAVAVVIPALNPDDKLLDLLKDLRQDGFQHVLLIDDGSAAEYATYFERAQSEFGCTVLYHAVNQGKGRALKTAFNYLLVEGSGLSAVTVDADGQHRLPDIAAVAEDTVAHPEALVLGCRDFSSETAGIPARSRFGNVLTSRLLRLLCGVKLSDTQTGLRGFSPQAMRTFLSTKGDRYEFEMNMILDAKENDMPLREVPIETVYLDGNESSHFNPLVDSFRIYAVFFKFIMSSLASYIFEYLLFLIFGPLLGLLLAPTAVNFASNCLARCGSAVFNYRLNRTRVFKNADTKGTLWRYAVLCGCIMLISSFLISFLAARLGFDARLIKPVVDTVLFLLSFRIQRGWVFGKR